MWYDIGRCVDIYYCYRYRLTNPLFRVVDFRSNISHTVKWVAIVAIAHGVEECSWHFCRLHWFICRNKNHGLEIVTLKKWLISNVYWIVWDANRSNDDSKKKFFVKLVDEQLENIEIRNNALESFEKDVLFNFCKRIISMRCFLWPLTSKLHSQSWLLLHTLYAHTQFMASVSVSTITIMTAKKTKMYLHVYAKYSIQLV